MFKHVQTLVQTLFVNCLNTICQKGLYGHVFMLQLLNKDSKAMMKIVCFPMFHGMDIYQTIQNLKIESWPLEITTNHLKINCFERIQHIFLHHQID